MKNILREKLLTGEKAVGTFFELGSLNAVECLGAAGIDFMIIDAEHGPYEAESAADFVRTADLRNITPLVRIKDCSRPAVLKMLDIGAKGLVVPSVNTVDEIKELVSCAKYFPVGKRGVCGAGMRFGATLTTLVAACRITLIPATGRPC